MKRNFNHAFIAFVNSKPSVYDSQLTYDRIAYVLYYHHLLHYLWTGREDLCKAFDVQQIRDEVPRSLLKRDGTWTVQAGDTGNGIATRLSIQFAQLATLNPGVNWNNLQIGQVLIIPCSDDSLPGNNTSSTSSLYTVVAGDTGNEIAANHGITFDQLEASNPGVNWYNLQIGQILILPGQQTATTSLSTSIFTSTSTSTTSSSFKSSSSTSSSTISSSTTFSSTASTSTTSALSITTSTTSRPTTSGSSTSASSTTTSTATMSTSAASTTSIAVVANFALPTSDPFLSPPVGNYLSRRARDASMQAAALLMDGNSKLMNARSNALSGACSKASTSTSSTSTSVTSTSFPIQMVSTTTTSTLKSTISTTSIVPSATSSRTYIVKSGDTGYAIAAAYGFPFSDLDASNPGVVWTNLQIGQVLNLPIHATTPFSNSTSSSSANITTRKPGTDVYITYTGPASNSAYPLMSSWMNFQDLWAANQQYIGTSCSFASGTVAPNTASENAALKNSILAVSNATGVNPSFILALVMQESDGCVRVPTTSSWQGITNPGLMQSFRGNGTCNSNGVALQPCPAVIITQMLLDGIAGSQGVGIVPALNQVSLLTDQAWDEAVLAAAAAAAAPLNTSTSTSASSTIVTTATTTSASAFARVTLVSDQQKLNTAQGTNGQMQQQQQQQQRRSDRRSTQISTFSSGPLDPAMLYYMAARIYNSGSIPADMDLGGPTESTRCYVSDIANRLMGWVAAPNTCYLS